MPIMELWDSNRQAVMSLNIEQVVTTSGDGKLKDNSECQRELREYLQQISVETLAEYAAHCLTTSFNKSGIVLQDIVNELGRRLEYEVTNGRYQGTVNEIGFDGLWIDPTGYGLVVEVKTTDVFRMPLDPVVEYRDKLISSGALEEPCSILLVVGRTDTGELEAQVRGSQHAWGIRLISVDALLRLVSIKESTDTEETIGKIRKLLTPIEYTRLDELIDVMFTAAIDVETSAASEAGEPDTIDEGAVSRHKEGWDFTPSSEIQDIRETIVTAVGRLLKTNFVKKTRAMYWNSDRKNRLACTISKRYENKGTMRYWYAYHPRWDKFLGEGENGLFALGGTDILFAFAIPLNIIRKHLDALNITEKKDGPYYHIKIFESEGGNYELQLPKADRNLDLTPYIVQI